MFTIFVAYINNLPQQRTPSQSYWDGVFQRVDRLELTNV